MLRHILQSGHPSVTLIDFKILGKGFKNILLKIIFIILLFSKNVFACGDVIYNQSLCQN